ncbi:DMT family transporter [Floccifex sp.]|uniref:DMT family transporter n=1 Tax=Floccifex sp. TaxID=2815810 RepID=UPI002A766760|nr:DMT family transporter [Floccifex sp.]MDD7280646.1 DMT family transporter [Erysipelotrichaceae bacterium]MDY2958019.1 DMT family transporter [Floccifex sp.]
MTKKYKGILFITCSAFCFALMNVFVKLAGDLPSIQKSFFRNLVACLFALILIIKDKEKLSYKKENIPLLLLRSTLGTIGILCNFYAVDHLVLSDASMLNKLSPFFVVLFSYVFLKEKASLFELGCVGVAFLGSLFVIRPSFDFAQMMPAIIGLIGAIGAGSAYTCVRALSLRNEKGVKIVFFFSAFSCIVTLPYLLFNYHPMTFAQLICLLCAGLAAAGGQFSITAAYANAPAKDISAFDYSQVIFSAIFSYFIFGQMPSSYSFIGYIIIICTGVVLFLKQRQKA